MKEILRKLNSVKQSIMAHPDYAMQDSGEFHDTVSTIEEIEQLVKNSCLDGVVGRSEQLCDHPLIERTYIGRNMLRCNKCGKEFS